MKAIFSTILFLLIINLHGYAQTEEGSFLIGGSGNISRPLNKNANIFSFNIAPQGGQFIADNLAIGAIPRFGYFHTELGNLKRYSIQIGISPFVRYYLGSSKIKLFFQGSLGVGYDYFNDNDGNYQYTSSGSNFFQNIGAGLVYFINENIGMEGLLNYNHQNSASFSLSSSGILLNLGFQIYLQRKIKNKNENEN